MAQLIINDTNTHGRFNDNVIVKRLSCVILLIIVLIVLALVLPTILINISVKADGYMTFYKALTSSISNLQK